MISIVKYQEDSVYILAEYNEKTGEYAFIGKEEALEGFEANKDQVINIEKYYNVYDKEERKKDLVGKIYLMNTILKYEMFKLCHLSKEEIKMEGEEPLEIEFIPNEFGHISYGVIKYEDGIKIVKKVFKKFGIEEKSSIYIDNILDLYKWKDNYLNPEVFNFRFENCQYPILKETIISK